MYVLLHAQPIFVTDFNATVSPFVVIGTFCWIEQSFFGILKKDREKANKINTNERLFIKFCSLNINRICCLFSPMCKVFLLRPIGFCSKSLRLVIYFRSKCNVKPPMWKQLNVSVAIWCCTRDIRWIYPRDSMIVMLSVSIIESTRYISCTNQTSSHVNSFSFFPLQHFRPTLHFHSPSFSTSTIYTRCSVVRNWIYHKRRIENKWMPQSQFWLKG